MKNSFNLEVNFSSSPKYPYEWGDGGSFIHTKVVRVSTKCLFDALMYEGRMVKSGVVLLSDGTNAAVFKLDSAGNIKARSFLKFEDELDVAEAAASLNEVDLEFSSTGEKVHYAKELSIESEMKKFLIDCIESCLDEDLSKYLYYLQFDEVKGYSREKLLTSIEKSSIDKNIKLYNFLIETQKA